MKARTAAIVILAYSVLLFIGSALGALREGHFSLFTLPVSGLLFIGPAIGIYKRINWCRIFLGVWFALIFVFFVFLPFNPDFHFKPIYLACLVGSGAPVYLLFLYSPLKEYTRNVPQPKSAA